MRNKLLTSPAKQLLFIWFLYSTTISSGQNQIGVNNESGGEISMQKNDEAHPCITLQEYVALEKECNENAKKLGLTTDNKKTVLTTLFDWPLRPVASFTDCNYYLILNYVDQDNTSAYKDWNCGTTTYNGHLGTDISIQPYPFYKMDHDYIDIIAAAPGTIVAKVDGNADKNCVLNNGTVTANSIIVQHSDGSRALYWHMKKNSLTSKAVGQTVVSGEFLGKVGSSGSSNTPHLHFEVWASNTFSSRQDPFKGTCNTLNANTWWLAQKSYTEPKLIKLQVNTIAPVFPACPATETPNEDTCSTPGASARFYYFIRDETPGLIANMRIINPNGTTYASWSHSSTSTINLAAYSSTQTIPATPGTYIFEGVYNGDTCRKNVVVGCNSVSGIISHSGLNELLIYPNPVNDILRVYAEGIPTGEYKLILKNVVGQILFEENIQATGALLQKNIAMAVYPKGLYYLSIENERNLIVKKIIKQE
jgi:murein DD-endopeptidase MepM/ murein hydrolase activator NlpD